MERADSMCFGEIQGKTSDPHQSLLCRAQTKERERTFFNETTKSDHRTKQTNGMSTNNQVKRKAQTTTRVNISSHFKEKS